MLLWRTYQANVRHRRSIKVKQVSAWPLSWQEAWTASPALLLYEVLLDHDEAKRHAQDLLQPDPRDELESVGVYEGQEKYHEEG